MRSQSLAPLIAGVLLFMSAAQAQEPGWKRYLDVKRVGTELAKKNKILLEPENELFVCDGWSGPDGFGIDHFSSHRDALFLYVAGIIAILLHSGELAWSR